MNTHDSLFKKYTEYIEANLLKGDPDSLYEPANYLIGLGGKRIRPLLSLYGYLLYKEDVSSCLPLAHAVEVFHNFTLMHDDIMDEAPLRRGQQTAHIKYGRDTAILSGDMMLVRAYKSLSGLGETSLQIIEDFNTMAEDVCRGQQMDMEFESRTDVQESEYTEMIRLKTAVLLGFSLKSGAVLAGCSNEDAEMLYAFANHVGIAFQIKDDLLDAFGEQAAVGKQIGGDIIEGKKTILYIKAIELANEEQREQLKQWYEDAHIGNEEKVNRVKALFVDSGAKDAVEELMNGHFLRANEILDTLVALNIQPLHEFISWIKNRVS
jgi:geranylgeranyl diphosphate synthase type II